MNESNKMKYCTSFGTIDKKDPIKEDSSNSQTKKSQGTQRKDSVNKNNTNTSKRSSQRDLPSLSYEKAIAKCGAEIKKFITKDSDPREIYNFTEAYLIHPTNAKELKSLHTSIEKQFVLLDGYRNQISIAQEVEAHTPEELKSLIEVLKKDNLDLNMIFDDSGSYIDYSKVKNLLNK